MERTKDDVKYIPMMSEGLYIAFSSPSNFKRRFPYSPKDWVDVKKIPSLKTLEVEHTARCYVTHALYAGASEECMIELEKLVTVTNKEKERIMGTNAEKQKKAEKPAKARTAKAAAEAKENGGKKVDGKTKKPVDGKTAERAKRSGAAATFKELIMAGKLTDDAIFAEVRKRHPEVSADRRNYVSWYRNALKKDGKEPPPARKE